jgi:hypothetical protein
LARTRAALLALESGKQWVRDIATAQEVRAHG